MACSKYSTQVTLEAARVYFGKEHLICIEPVLAVATDTSFIVSNQDESFQVWFNVDGAGVAPVPAAGETLIEVAVVSGYTLSEMALALDAVLKEHFYVIIPKEDGSEVILETFTAGERLAAPVDVDSTFMIEEMQAGFNIDLGNTSSGIEVTLEGSNIEVTADQTGPLVLAELIQATVSSLTVDLQDLSEERLNLLIAEGFGDSHTPTTGTRLVGYGTSKIGTNSLEIAGRLTLHPIRLEDNDRSADMNYWKTVPNVTSTNYSGTEKRVLNVEFKALVDEFKPEEISLMAFGDGTQNLLA
tara:strand:+ start:1300 stop:2199 length:900 start_codon:yes stop_codon:yes gene_type:complete